MHSPIELQRLSSLFLRGFTPGAVGVSRWEGQLSLSKKRLGPKVRPCLVIDVDACLCWRESNPCALHSCGAFHRDTIAFLRWMKESRPNASCPGGMLQHVEVANAWHTVPAECYMAALSQASANSFCRQCLQILESLRKNVLEWLKVAV